MLYSAIKKPLDGIKSLWDPGFLPFFLGLVLQTLNRSAHKAFYNAVIYFKRCGNVGHGRTILTIFRDTVLWHRHVHTVVHLLAGHLQNCSIFPK